MPQAQARFVEVWIAPWVADGGITAARTHASITAQEQAEPSGTVWRGLGRTEGASAGWDGG